MRKYTKRNNRKNHINSTKRRKWKRNKSIRRYKKNIHKRSLTGGATCFFYFRFAEHEYKFTNEFSKFDIFRIKQQYTLTQRNKLNGTRIYKFTLDNIVNICGENIKNILHAILLLYTYKNDDIFCHSSRLLDELSKKYKPTDTECVNCMNNNTPFHSIEDDTNIIKLIIQNKDNHNETKKLLYTYGIIKYLYPDAETSNLYCSMPISKIDRTLPDIFSKIKSRPIYTSDYTGVSIYKMDDCLFKIIDIGQKSKNPMNVDLIQSTLINECINYNKIISLCGTDYLCELISIYLEYIEDDKKPSLPRLYILIKNCGYNLLDIIFNQKESITESVIYKWFYDIALGIRTMHSNRCIHRDIKPENITFDSSGIAKLIDFGQAIFIDDYSFGGLTFEVKLNIKKSIDAVKKGTTSIITLNNVKEFMKSIGFNVDDTEKTLKELFPDKVVDDYAEGIQHIDEEVVDDYAEGIQHIDEATFVDFVMKSIIINKIMTAFDDLKRHTTIHKSNLINIVSPFIITPEVIEFTSIFGTSDVVNNNSSIRISFIKEVIHLLKEYPLTNDDIGESSSTLYFDSFFAQEANIKDNPIFIKLIKMNVIYTNANFNIDIDMLKFIGTGTDPYILPQLKYLMKRYNKFTQMEQLPLCMLNLLEKIEKHAENIVDASKAKEIVAEEKKDKVRLLKIKIVEAYSNITMKALDKVKAYTELIKMEQTYQNAIESLKEVSKASTQAKAAAAEAKALDETESESESKSARNAQIYAKQTSDLAGATWFSAVSKTAKYQQDISRDEAAYNYATNTAILAKEELEKVTNLAIQALQELEALKQKVKTETETAEEEVLKAKSQFLLTYTDYLQETIFKEKNLFVDFFKKCDIYSLSVSLIICLYIIEPTCRITKEAIFTINPQDLIQSFLDQNTNDELYNLCKKIICSNENVDIDELITVLDTKIPKDNHTLVEKQKYIVSEYEKKLETTEFFEKWESGI
jgi:serine/threonine protein kinase